MSSMRIGFVAHRAAGIVSAVMTLGIVSIVWADGSSGNLGEYAGAAPRELFIEPIAGLTTARHLAPDRMTVPLGTDLGFLLSVPESASVTLSGADLMARTSEGVHATCTLTQLGPAIVEALTELADGTLFYNICHVDVVPTSVQSIAAENLTVTVAQFEASDHTPNEERVRLHFGESIAALNPLVTPQSAVATDGRSNNRRTNQPGIIPAYSTSVQRTIDLTAVFSHVEFAPLMEWRIDGHAHSIGQSTKISFSTVGMHHIEVGPPDRCAKVMIQTYRTVITSHTAGENSITEGDWITFEAVTDPPGFEDEITWLSSTKYGSAEPAVGHGPNFTARFTNTFGPLPEGGTWQWVGVKADQAPLGQDQKPHAIADPLPRSQFIHNDGFPFFPWQRECNRWFCKRYPNDGAFDCTFIWTHITHTGRVPGPIWLDLCLDDSFGRIYRHVVLRPGQTHWIIAKINRGDTGWIGTWLTVPFPFGIGDVLELAMSAGGEEDSTGNLINEAAGTLQMALQDTMDQSTESVDFNPGAGDQGSWIAAATHQVSETDRIVTETWASATNPVTNQSTISSLTPSVNGFSQVIETDAGDNGSIDHTVSVDFEDLGATKSLSVSDDEGGSPAYSYDVTLTEAGATTTIVTETDTDGDGTIDMIETEVATTVGTTTNITIDRDLDNDGTLDERETRSLDFCGLRDSTEVIEIRRPPAGPLAERISITMTPTADGYCIETMHDSDGDGTFDTVERHTATVGPFANGLDTNTVMVDADANGVFDSTMTSVTDKLLVGTSYTEVVETDTTDDGVADATTERTITFVVP